MSFLLEKKVIISLTIITFIELEEDYFLFNNICLKKATSSVKTAIRFSIALLIQPENC